MKNKRRLIVLLLTLAMVMSQMSFVAFAGTEAAGESDQTVTEQAAVETAFDQTVTENGVDITVKAAEGVFPAGAKLSAKKVDVPDAIDAENALAFDIKILVDGEEVQPKDNAKVEVSFKTAEVKKNETEVYHMDGSKADKLDVETKGTTATVETTGFSTYVLVFTAGTGETDTLNYSMVDEEPVELNDLLDGFTPSNIGTTTTWEWLFAPHTSPVAPKTNNSKIEFDVNGLGNAYVAIADGATFADGENVKIQVPYRYWIPESGGTDAHWSDTQWANINIKINNADHSGLVTEPTAITGLTEDGSAQQLINAGVFAAGSFEYNVGSGWKTAVADITGTEAGEYPVQWRALASGGAVIQEGTVTAVIAEKTLPKSGGLTVTYTDANSSKPAPTYAYDRAAHGIASVTMKKAATEGAEAPAGVKVYYSYDYLDETNYIDGVDDVSSLNPTDAGTTRIYYYVTASNYAPEKGYSEITINKAVAYITVKNKHLTYGDDPIAYNTVTLPSAVDKDYVAITAVRDEKEATLVSVEVSTNDISNLSEAKFNYGKYTCENTSDVGAYNISLEENLVADNFVIKPVAGKLTIHPKQVDFVWSTKSTWEYDGQPHIITAKVDPDDLVPSDRELVTINYVTDDEDNYTWKEETNVKRGSDWAVKPYQYKVDSLGGRGYNYIFFGTATEATDYNTAVNAKIPAADNFTVNYTATTTNIGNMWILPLTLTLTPDDLTIPYGDDPKTYAQTFKSNGLLDGETIGDVLIGDPEYKYYRKDTTTEYAPGNHVTNDSNKYEIKIVNVENATDTVAPKAETPYDTHNLASKTVEDKEVALLHAQNYQVAVATGTLNVIPRVIEKFNWKVEAETLEYDGNYKYAYVESVENDYLGSGGVHSALEDAQYANVKQINAGTYTSTITLTGDAAENYVIKEGDTTSSYTWTITKRPATIYVNSNTITYGQDPAYNGYYIDNKAELTYPNEETGEYDKIADITPASGYNKYGKPGQYAIGAVVENLDPNYYIADIKQGTLTVNDVVTTLNAKGTKKGSKGILVSWNGVTGAASYDVYMSLCNTKKKNYTPVYVGSTAGTSFKVTKIGKKKLKTRTPYKYYVVAKDAAGNPITRSSLGHFITNNVKGKQVNAKSMSVNTHVVSIGKGGTAGLSASYKKAKKGKKYKLLDGVHAPLSRFVSENPAVATVDANGTVTGVGTGWTRVYVQGVSGMWETVEVNVQ